MIARHPCSHAPEYSIPIGDVVVAMCARCAVHQMPAVVAELQRLRGELGLRDGERCVCDHVYGDHTPDGGRCGEWLCDCHEFEVSATTEEPK